MEKPTIREYLTSIVFIGVLGVFLLLSNILPTPLILPAERRAAARFPDISMNIPESGNFASGFENWAADNFAFRDTFRAVNTVFIFDVYRQSDKSGLYRSDDVGLGRFRQIDDTVLQQGTERIHAALGIFSDIDVNVYYSIIPDKSEYAGEYLPGFFVREAERVFSQTLDRQEYIALTESLNAGSYYKTDLHWDQTKIEGAAETLLSAMGAESISVGYEKRVAGEFHGIYAGEYALRVAADIMGYTDLHDLRVSYLSAETMEPAAGQMYDINGFNSIDPYDFFLKGPQPLVVIENSGVPERELYMFRDSFGSSLAPLLAQGYSKVVLIDLRYIHASMVDRYVEFKDGSDVLFIYSSQIISNPDSLQS